VVPKPRAEAPAAPMPEPDVAMPIDDVRPEDVTLTPEQPEPPASTSDDLLERVRQACKESNKELSALLNGSCEVKSAEGGSVVLGFYHTFHLERIESGPQKQQLDQVFSAVLGRPIQVSYEHAPRERTTVPPAKGGHLVIAAQELGARTISRTDDGEGGQDG
jgi:hypothetical protein